MTKYQKLELYLKVIAYSIQGNFGWGLILAILVVGANCAKYKHLKLICDVIWEKVPYCRTNIVGPDQTPSIMHGVWSGHTIFVKYRP